MLINMLASISDEALKKLKEANPEERQNMARMAAEFLTLSTQLLKESPEFRSAFALIHSEFLKYPESGDTIRQAIHAQRELISDTRPAGSMKTAH